jgi:hypothetical protein
MRIQPQIANSQIYIAVTLLRSSCNELITLFCIDYGTGFYALPALSESVGKGLGAHVHGSAR